MSTYPDYPGTGPRVDGFADDELRMPVVGARYRYAGPFGGSGPEWLVVKVLSFGDSAEVSMSTSSGLTSRGCIMVWPNDFAEMAVVD